MLISAKEMRKITLDNERVAVEFLLREIFTLASNRAQKGYDNVNITTVLNCYGSNIRKQCLTELKFLGYDNYKIGAEIFLQW